jgi:transposase
VLAGLHDQVLAAERKLDELAREDGQVKLLETVPGVGTRLAEAVAICLDDPHRFGGAAEVSSYAGLLPKPLESGTMKRIGRITRRRPDAAPRDAGGGGVDGLAAQRLGQGVRRSREPWAMLRDHAPWRGPSIALT